MTLPPKRLLAVDDLARLRWAMEPSLHRDGVTLAYVVSGPDLATDELGYELHLSRGPSSEALVSGARKPKWSPDGRALAFLWKEADVWEMGWYTEGEGIRRLPGLPGDVTAFDWDPSGEGVVCAVSSAPAEAASGDVRRVHSAQDWTGRRGSELWLLPVDGEPERLTDEDHDSLPAWSPDGRRIAFLSQRGVDTETSTGIGVWCLDVASRRVELLVPPDGVVRAIAWSPDSVMLALLRTSRDRSSAASAELWVLDTASDTRQQLAQDLDRNIGQAVRGDDERGIGPPSLAWSPDGTAVYAIFADGGRSVLARFGLDGSWTTVVGGDRSVLEFSASGSIAYSWSDPTTPGEVSVVDTDGATDIVRSSAGADLGSEIAASEAVSVIASDGERVEGWLTRPLGGNPPHPLVLQVHGGPHYPVGWRFSFDAQRLAAQGIAVLRANPRGSHGYGSAFAEGNLGDWGGRDHEDLMQLVEKVASEPDVDGERMAIIGESYGGYMAAWSVTQTGRFVAAVAENGISDLVSSAAGTSGPTFWHEELGGAPWEVPATYVDRSPIFHVDRIDTPLLLIHCEADATCDIGQSEALFAALRSLGKEVEFVRVPGEGHFFNVFGSISRRMARTRVLDEFLVRHLLHPAPTHREEHRHEGG